MTQTQFYNSFLTDLMSGNINLVNHTLKAVLVYNYAFSPVQQNLGQITGELLAGNGYTTGGNLLTGCAISLNSDNQAIWTANDLTWTASGGTLGPATGAVIYDASATTPTTNRLCCYVDFGGPQVATSGSGIILTFGANGIVSFTAS